MPESDVPASKYLTVLLLSALRESTVALDAYRLAGLMGATPMAVGQALSQLEVEERVASKDTSGTANDLARQFVFKRYFPKGWYKSADDRPPFEFEDRWWFVAVEGFTIGQVKGPFKDRGTALKAWTDFWEFQDAMDNG